MSEAPRDPAVPLADVEVAQRIAAAAREGGPADRTPTVAQLLAAFGGDESGGPAALARVERALEVAGVGVSPPLVQAPAGSRVTLSPGRGPGRGRGGRGRALILGALAIVVVIVGVAAAAAALGGSDREDRASALPSGSTATTAVSPATTPAAAQRAAADRTRKAEQAERAKAEAAEAEQAKAAGRRSEQRRREERAAAERAAAAKRRVVVTLSPSEPTYVCIDDARGTRVFGGTLARRQTFRGRRLRLNIGLSSVTVRVDGKRLALAGSPSGYLVQAGGSKPRYLPPGQRPEC
jgi:hypothetical protein